MELRTRPRWSSITVRAWDMAVLGTTLVMLAWLFYKNAMLASRVIDGTRIFTLDDDMMISMRYARNLAEGNGLVWNPGERVEGYTNFLWTMVMSALHLTRVADHHMALLVRGAGFAFLAGTFVLALRIVRVFAPRSYLAAPVLLVSMINCTDIIHWSVWGFETGLLSFLNLLVLSRLVERREDVVCYVALALIGLTRSDTLYILLANALIALFLSSDPRKTAIRIALALVPFALHLIFRRVYYGELLPNTYYLKVYLLEDVRKRGALYARNFLLTYPVLLTLAAGGALAVLRTDRRGIILFVAVLATLLYVITTGGDMFGGFRFLSHAMPLVFVFAAVGVSTATRGVIGSAVWAAVVFFVSVPLVKPMDRLIVLDGNGDPYDQLQVAMTVKKNALPTSTVAVIPAGILPYFTRMKAIDILGKSDKHVARLKPFPGAMVGHGKLDPDYTLGQKPDLVISCRSHAWAAAQSYGARTTDVVLSFLSSPAFRTYYLPYPVTEDFTIGHSAVYTHVSSAESGHRTWKSVTVKP